MLDDVGQGLLQDPVGRHAQSRGHFAQVALGGHVDLDAATVGVGDELVEASDAGLGAQRAIVVSIGAQDVQEPAELSQRLAAGPPQPKPPNTP